jgi:hypothetical protein
MESITTRELEPELVGLSTTERILYCSEKIKEIDKKIRELRQLLLPLEDEELYWIYLKREEVLKLTPVKKIPAGVSGHPRVKENLLVSVDKIFESMSEEQRAIILARLGG